MTFASSFGRVFSPTFHPKSQAAAAASTFVPTDITGCKLWLDFGDADTLFTDAGTTKVNADAQEIYQANDKSGNGNHLSRGAAGKSATYKTNIKNSLSVGRFDGTDDYMSATFAFNQPAHYFIVCQWRSDTVAGNKRIFDGKAAANSFFMFDTSKTFGMQGSKVASGLLARDTSFHIFRCLFYGASSKFGNNAASYSTIDIGTGNPGGVTLGAYINGGFNGPVDICEFCAYDNSISESNEASLLGYLNNKWAIY